MDFYDPPTPEVLLLLAFDEFHERTVETSTFLEAHRAGPRWLVGLDVDVTLPKTNRLLTEELLHQLIW